MGWNSSLPKASKISLLHRALFLRGIIQYADKLASLRTRAIAYASHSALGYICPLVPLPPPDEGEPAQLADECQIGDFPWLMEDGAAHLDDPFIRWLWEQQKAFDDAFSLRDSWLQTLLNGDLYPIHQPHSNEETEKDTQEEDDDDPSDALVCEHTVELNRIMAEISASQGDFENTEKLMLREDGPFINRFRGFLEHIEKGECGLCLGDTVSGAVPEANSHTNAEPITASHLEQLQKQIDQASESQTLLENIFTRFKNSNNVRRQRWRRHDFGFDMTDLMRSGGWGSPLVINWVLGEPPSCQMSYADSYFSRKRLVVPEYATPGRVERRRVESADSSPVFRSICW